MLVTAAPAHAEAKHEIIIVANGPSYAVLNMPANVFLNMPKSSLTGSTPYGMIVVTQGTNVTTAVDRLPKRDTWNGADRATIPKGKSILRVLVAGKVSIRIPVIGISGSRTIKLTKRLTDTTAVVRDVPVNLESFSDDIPFKTRSDAVVVHGVTRVHDVPLVGLHASCVAPEGTPCSPPTGTGMPGTSYSLKHTHRSSHAYVSHTGVGIGRLPIQHFLFAVPY